MTSDKHLIIKVKMQRVEEFRKVHHSTVVLSFSFLSYFPSMDGLDKNRMSKLYKGCLNETILKFNIQKPLTCRKPKMFP